jgi:hypothetical protein
MLDAGKQMSAGERREVPMRTARITKRYTSVTVEIMEDERPVMSCTRGFRMLTLAESRTVNGWGEAQKVKDHLKKYAKTHTPEETMEELIRATTGGFWC